MLTTWTERINRTTDRFIEEFSALDFEQLNFKPNKVSWSIGQCIDHIIVTNELYFKIIEQINQGVYRTFWLGRVPFIPKLLGRIILKSVQPETINKKQKTFPVFEPSQSEISADILSRFNMMQLQLKAYLSEISPSNYTRVISSPVASYVVYSLKDAIEIILAHEERHFLQAQAVKKLLKKTN